MGIGGGFGDPFLPANSFPIRKPTRKPSKNFFFFNNLNRHSTGGNKCKRHKPQTNTKTIVCLDFIDNIFVI